MGQNEDHRNKTFTSHTQKDRILQNGSTVSHMLHGLEIHTIYNK